MSNGNIYGLEKSNQPTMALRWTDIVIGLAVVGLGLLLILFGSGYSVATCFNSSCTTDYTGLATSIVFMTSGVLSISFGIRKIWMARERL